MLLQFIATDYYMLSNDDYKSNDNNNYWELNTGTLETLERFCHDHILA